MSFAERDPLLGHFRPLVEQRRVRLAAARTRLEPFGPLSFGHHYFGFTAAGEGRITYREWAPAAQGLFLIGDFNGWDREATPLTRGESGVWEVTLPLELRSRVKVHIVGADGSRRDRLPAYLRRTVQDEHSKDFVGEVWLAPEALTPGPSPHVSSYLRALGGEGRGSGVPPLPKRRDVGVTLGEGLGVRAGLRIYEAHVGMAQEAAGVGSFAAFTERILPRIATLGYNAVQLMAVQEHPYYGSFGYHVSSFFAVSSRFGTPDDLRALIAEAHRLGLSVLMDLVHSHAVKNVNEGLAELDGTPYQYFHEGARGYHPAWDSLCFDYGKDAVRGFLLSNCRYWLEEYGFDGFRFDGVTSMLYHDHGLGRAFTHYDHYFGENVDEDALLYLQLANDLVHLVRPGAVTVAEDMSGMPGMARPTDEGGLGFDYRLTMGVPDFWIRTLKEVPDEQWSVGEVWGTLTNRRADEKHIAYAESHDQSIVGDKTLAMWLLDAAIYTEMALDRQSVVVDRGIALHKLIRLLTRGLAGEGWLSFIGNEFGHPEWVDFPREGNGWSYEHARRQWSLVDSPFLRYQHLNAFDAALMHLPLPEALPELLLLHEEKKLLVWSRGELVFAVNLHPSQSYPDLRIPVPVRSDYQLVLDTDQNAFSGQGRIAAGGRSVWEPTGCEHLAQSLLVYLPSRCGIVLAPEGK